MNGQRRLGAFFWNSYSDHKYPLPKVRNIDIIQIILVSGKGHFMPVERNDETVTSTEFSKKVGKFMEKSAKAPVFITKYNRPARVLLDIEEYERLKQRDTRRALAAADMSDEHKGMIANAEYGQVAKN
jgi:prevent-host-death family protein